MDLKSLNWVDFAILAIVVFSTIISFIRGFIREALSLAIWIVALYLAYIYSDIIASRYLGSIEEANIRIVVAFLIIFFAVIIIGAFINYLFSRLVQSTGLSGTDRILGLGFGIARGLLLVAVLILVAQMTVLPQNKAWQQSQFVPEFEGLTQWLRSFLPEGIDKLGKISTEKKQTKLQLRLKRLAMNQQLKPKLKQNLRNLCYLHRQRLNNRRSKYLCVA